MDKNAIKKYAVWARRELISRVSQKAAFYGITNTDHGTVGAESVDGRVLTAAEKKQRDALIHQIQKDGYEQTIEEVAYTWFNRFSALRYMEVNGYLPTHVRVFTDDTGALKPQILTEAINLELDGLDMQKVYDLKNSNQDEALYRYLLITQCNALNAILPGMFQKIEDYTELLLPDNLLREGSVIEQMVTTIPEEDWTDQVQIIGWMYQYYNAEKKDDVFAALKKNVKITKENIPAATQLFTPDWIVRYMVQNSLGRLFIDKRKNEGVFADGRGLDEMTWDEAEEKRITAEKHLAEQMEWKYYLPEAAQTKEVREQLDKIQQQSEYKDVRDIKVIDPCMGSGHILVYAFDVLMQMYEDAGYNQRDAAKSILENNLYGLDIDDRAYQLAYFAVMMKARQYNRRILNGETTCQVYAIQESNNINRTHLKYLGAGMDDLEVNTARVQVEGLLDTLRDAKEYGSILKVESYNWELLRRFVSAADAGDQVTLDSAGLEVTVAQLLTLIDIAETIAQKYDVVVTNPPYMAISNGDARLNEYVKKNYPDSKADLFAVFIECCSAMTEQNRYQAMITQHSWMFLSSFEKLRKKLLRKDTINMAHLGPRAFEEIGGEVVQTTSFVMRKSHVAEYKGTYCRLIDPPTQRGKEDMFLAGKNRYTAQQSNFSKIPGSPVAYWVSDLSFQCFAAGLLFSYAETKQGFKTGDNERFLRLWYECSVDKESFSGDKEKKWFPCTKGGEFRRWYGNFEYIVDWENDGYKIKNFFDSNGKLRSRPQNLQINFTKQLTWSSISSGNISFRQVADYFMYESKGPVLTPKIDFDLMLAYLNTKVYQYFISVVAPTLDYSEGAVLRVPYVELRNDQINQQIMGNVGECVNLSRYDWDSFETSWDFQKHPLVPLAHERQEQESSQFRSSRIEKFGSIAWHYDKWAQECEGRFNQLKANEEELNRIFIDIYGLQDELTPEVEDKDVTVRKADLQRDIKSLLSYAVGCMFGRYSLDSEGLAYAGGDWDESKYKTFLPDVDGIIPITDEEYLGDDIVTRLCSWLKIVYGEDTLEENVDFIAKALGGRGSSSREIIRNYFLKDFFKDHCKIYQKRPIYWLFDSGKQNGFKALIYLHRYTPDTIGNLRVDYLHKMQRVYESEIGRMQDMIDHSTNAREVAAATKRKEKLQKQLKECREYDEMIGHLALSRIELDLDDGVKVNYEKIQTASDGKKYSVLAKI